MKRERRQALNRIRAELVAQYHALSDVIVQSSGPGLNVDPDGGELGAAFDKISEAINCLNRETGRPEN